MDTTIKQSFVKLIQQHKGILFKICNAYCRNKDDREDLAQEMIYQLWKSYEAYKPDYKYSTWMYRIALNVAISFYRKQTVARATVGLHEHLFEFGDDRDEPPDVHDNLSRLQQFIAALQELDRALMLLYLEEKNHKEIAEILGISETNVGTKISRIKEKLKRQFATTHS